MIKKLTFLGLCCLVSLSVFSQNIPFKQKASADSLKKTLTFLASDSLKGRLSGNVEQQVAARYIAASFKQHGLNGASGEKENPYFNSFYLMRYGFLSSYKIKIQDSEETISPYTNMHIASAKTLTSCSFIPLMGNADSLKGPDVAKVVTAATLDDGIEEIKRGLTTNPRIERYMLVLPPYKMKEYNKARIALQFSQAAYTNEKGDTLIFGWASETTPLSSNIYYKKIYPFINSHPGITLLITDELQLKRMFSDTTMLKEYATSSKPTIGKTLVLNGTIPPDKIRYRKVANVVGIFEGTSNKDEAIVVSAHYDHIGISAKRKMESASADSICNGADDNASGTSAMMEVARLFAEAKAQGIQPKRSILFVAFTGEEAGLLGSRYMTYNPFFPLEKIKANVNLDMVGRNDAQHTEWDMYAYTIAFGDTVALQKTIDQSAKKAKLELPTEFNPEEKERWRKGSDHASFVQKNIPAIAVTTGMHADYHQPSDEVKKINFKRLERIATFTYFVAWELANR